MIRLVILRNRSKHVFESVLNGYNSLGVYYLYFLLIVILNYIFSFVRPKTFYFQKKTYQYFYHPYNHTWMNERAIEIPIVYDKIKSFKGEILEVGNVLSNYFSVNHDILDKYDNTSGIINEDVATFKSKKKYDLIISISTLEHVGWEDGVKDPKKILNSIKNLKKHLTKKGKIIATVPLGYNPHLDKLLESGIFDECYFLKRKMLNRWQEVIYENIKGIGYIRDMCANALAIIVINP